MDKNKHQVVFWSDPQQQSNRFGQVAACDAHVYRHVLMSTICCGSRLLCLGRKGVNQNRR
jgi:hypothetical protein